MDDATVDQLLRRNRLEQYAPLFRQHAIRSDVLFDLTHEDLVDVGVASIGHRARLLQLIDAQRPLDARRWTPSTDTLAATLPSKPSTAASSSGSVSAGLSLIDSPASILTPLPAAPIAAAAANAADSAPASGGGGGGGGGGAHASHSAPSTASAASPAGVRAAQQSDAARENVLLRQRVEASERQIRKLSEQLVRLRADLFRKFKESEPLPTPTGRPYSPGSTPGATPGAAQARRSPSDGYFPRLSQQQLQQIAASTPGASATPAATSPVGRQQQQNQHHHHHHATHGHGHQGQHTPSPSHAQHGASSANLPFGNTAEAFKKFRCGEKDNALKVLTALHQQRYLEGDASLWRLQIEYGDKARELLDHEYPLVVFKQLQEQGHRPMFTTKQIQPHRPPEHYL